MTTKPKRPPSVWISQILLGLYILLLCAIFLMSVMAFINPNPVRPHPIAFIFILAFLAVFVAAFVGLTARKIWGRWLAFGLLSLMFLGALLSQFNQLFSAGNMPRNSAQWTGYVMGGLIIMVPFAFLIFRLGFGDPAHDFFNPPDESEQMFEPPPPPTFTE